ncbi:MAG: N-acetyl-gamma-glutamyl-phosphate reductase [Nitrospiraceae bacterium]|nr:MAG: N-acetyl-gamma-glutamyl-phosphate reductase [Nitrospiraceae bacterium]
MIHVALIGGSGYTGSELLRLLLGHPDVKVTAVTSERFSGTPVSDTFLQFRNTGLTFESLNLQDLTARADLFFLCLPHKTSQKIVADLHKAGKKVIDLSADYRLNSSKIYESWYKTPHLFSALLRKAVYGLPEINRDMIKKAFIIANPGCYPTSAILGLAPVMGRDYVDTDSIIVDSKSGTSGAGRNPAQPFMFCEVNESVRAYGISVHRHTPEIEQELSTLSKNKVRIIFTPHLIPMDRGILSTIYVRLKERMKLSEIQEHFREYYKKEPFVRVLKNGDYPLTKAVKGTNFCDISVFLDNRSGKGYSLIVVSAIDNLIKGASGSAVQNMNIMYGLEETAGLMTSSPTP